MEMLVPTLKVLSIKKSSKLFKNKHVQHFALDLRYTPSNFKFYFNYKICISKLRYKFFSG